MTILQHTARCLRLLAERMDPPPKFAPNGYDVAFEPDYEDEHNWGERPV